MNLTVGTAAWGDSDGFAGATDAGWVGIKNLHVNTLHIYPRSDFTATPAQWTNLQFLTIDVGTDPGGTTKVHIGIPTITITMTSMDTSVELGPTTALGQVMGSVYVAGLEMATAADAGSIDIYAHGASGVTMDLNTIKIDYLDLDVASWGDADGCPTYAPTGQAGFVGIDTLAMTDIEAYGQVTIDVGTIDTGSTDGFNPVYATTLGQGKNGPTFVCIGLNSMGVHLGTMLGTVKLGTANDLTSAGYAEQVLGDIYVAGVDATLSGYVHIFAH